MVEDWNFDLFGGPKWPENQVHVAHIQQIFKSSSNEYVNQETTETFWEMTKTHNFDLFGRYLRRFDI